MKHGANFSDQNKIRKLAAEGLSATDISVKLQIEESCVKGFMAGAKAKRADPQPAAPTFDFTEESLQAVAAESGMSGLREIAEPHGVKGSSKEKIIEDLLKVKAKHESAGE